MGTYTIRIVQNGKPVEGAEVTCGERFCSVTDAKGEVSTGPIDLKRPIACPVHVLKEAKADGDSSFQFGGGPFRINPDEVCVIEV